MPVIVTRMPSTGRVVNIATGYGTVEECRARWADNDAVTVYSDEEYDDLPKCCTCGGIDGTEGCHDCRP